VFITDYTIEWTSLYRATLSWDGGIVSSWWTIFIDGRPAVTFEGSGDISQSIQARENRSHSIAIVKHEQGEDLTSPEAARLLRPTIRWLSVDYAAQYLVYEVASDDTEYLIHKEEVEDGISTKVYSWQIPINLPREGVDVERIKVYARGSWGLCETPSAVAGFIGGHPPRAVTVEVDTPSTGIELQISTA